MTANILEGNLLDVCADCQECLPARRNESEIIKRLPFINYSNITKEVFGNTGGLMMTRKKIFENNLHKKNNSNKLPVTELASVKKKLVE